MTFTARPTTTVPTTGFVLFRTYQEGLVARNRCCVLNQAGLSTYTMKRTFVGKVQKIDSAKSITFQRLKHVSRLFLPDES